MVAACCAAGRHRARPPHLRPCAGWSPPSGGRRCRVACPNGGAALWQAQAQARLVAPQLTAEPPRHTTSPTSQAHAPIRPGEKPRNLMPRPPRHTTSPTSQAHAPLRPGHAHPPLPLRAPSMVRLRQHGHGGCRHPPAMRDPPPPGRAHGRGRAGPGGPQAAPPAPIVAWGAWSRGGG